MYYLLEYRKVSMILLAFIWAHLLGNREMMIPIEKGSSNESYQLVVEDTTYFVRFVPEKAAVYSDLEIEAKVLDLLEPLDVSPKLLYYNLDNRVMVTSYIEHEVGKVDLLDPLTRAGILELVHKIEESGITISRVFRPYRDIMDLAERAHHPLPKEFYDLLPKLRKIDDFLANYPRKCLCHLDLHSGNVLQKGGKYWLIDWEYTVMAHPFLALASMASIECWDDDQMRVLLSDYLRSEAEEDFHLLYLYRIVADLFWTVWSHVQIFESSIEGPPYAKWEELFFQAALERAHLEEEIFR